MIDKLIYLHHFERIKHEPIIEKNIIKQIMVSYLCRTGHGKF